MSQKAKDRIRECLEMQSTSLDLSECELKNLKQEVPELLECSHLERLFLWSNQLADVSALANLTNLTQLELGSNKLTNVSALSGLTNLTFLSLGNNQLTDVSTLANLTNLTNLWLNNTLLMKLGALSGLKNLMRLGLENNQLTEVSIISGLTNLEVLRLSNNHLKKVDALSNLTKLTELRLSYNQLTDVSGLSGLTNLTDLFLDRNQLTQISALSGLTNLTRLVLSNNHITNVNELSGLTNLTDLCLDRNELNEIDGLSGLTNLTFLLLEFNGVNNVGALSGLSNLRKLGLYGNPISDFKPLLFNQAYRERKISIYIDNSSLLNKIVEQGYEALKKYYDTLEVEGRIQNDQLKVILLGNSTTGKTSLARYWGKKEFSERQLTTHGLARSLELPLRLDDTNETFLINVWDFGGQDYYHATHRLFITRDSTYVLVCNRELENQPQVALTTEYMQVGDEEVPVQIPVQHYPYRYWLQTLAFLTKADRIDEHANRGKDKIHLPKLFLVENKCGTYEGKRRMRLDDTLSEMLPFEVVGEDFFHLDIREAYRYRKGKDTTLSARRFSDNFNEFEEQILSTLSAQISDNRYEVHKNYPDIRDLLVFMAAYQQNREVSAELNHFLAEEKIAPIEQYEKLPVWMTYVQYQNLVRRNSHPSIEPDFNSLHIYLQNLCGRILHFREIEELKDIVFIDPNWLHQTIYKVLSQKVLDDKGEFSLEQADDVIDGNILDASQFMEVMKQFELVFEIPRQTPRRFVAPQYLPVDYPPEATEELSTYQELFHKLALTLQFPHYLPPSLISRVISLKGHLIKKRKAPLWRNGVIYTEHGLSIFLLCTPEARKIEVYLSPTDEATHQKVLREFMYFMEKKFPNETEEVLLSLPSVVGLVKRNEVYHALKEKTWGVRNYDESLVQKTVDARPFAFLFEEFERKPINVFVCYAHDDGDEMGHFTEALQKELWSFQAQHKIRIDSFTDLELRPGMLWDKVLKEQIKTNDILICLLSPSFFGSGYIEQNEYGQVMREIAAGQRDSLIAPVYLKACYVAGANPIANLQFFNPPAKAFGLRGHMANFSFSNLLDRRKKSLVENYVASFVESIKPGILEIWERK